MQAKKALSTGPNRFIGSNHSKPAGATAFHSEQKTTKLEYYLYKKVLKKKLQVSTLYEADLPFSRCSSSARARHKRHLSQRVVRVTTQGLSQEQHLLALKKFGY
jgi:hypothetical protein